VFSFEQGVCFAPTARSLQAVSSEASGLGVVISSICVCSIE